MTTESSESKRAWGISLAFWLCLLLATALYAAVALAPKLLTHVTLKQSHYTNQVRLVSLERQVQYLRSVSDALENEPEFAAELARVDFDATRPGDERIPVDRTLSLDARSVPSLPSGELPWYTPLLKVFAGNRRVRTATLAAAAVLTLIAFTFLHGLQATGYGLQASDRRSP